MTLLKLVETSKYHLSCMYYSFNECYGDNQPVNYRVQFTLCVEEIMCGTVAHDEFCALIIMWIVTYENGWIHMLMFLCCTPNKMYGTSRSTNIIAIRSACASSHPFTNFVDCHLKFQNRRYWRSKWRLTLALPIIFTFALKMVFGFWAHILHSS